MNRQPQLVVEVEPLSDQRWARIERQLFARVDERPEIQGPGEEHGRRRMFAWAGVAVAVTAAVFVVVHSERAVHREDRVSLATTDSASEFTLGESSLTVAPRSLVVVSGDDDHGVAVLLDRGTVTCEVAPRRGRPPFRLDAGEVRIRVVGTRFTVTRDQGETSVDVEHGAVEVAARGIVTVLHDGGHWRDPVVPSPAPTHDEVSSLAGESESMAASQMRSLARTPHTRRPATVETPAPAVEATTSEPMAMGQTTTPPVVPEAQQAFEAASRSERTNPVQAAAIYRQLAAGGTDWAPNALFALGRLQADRGHRAEATRLLNAYLTRYPRGINADDALDLLRRLR